MRKALLKYLSPWGTRAARPAGYGLALLLLFAGLHQGFWQQIRTSPEARWSEGRATVLASPRWWQKWTGNRPLEIKLRPGTAASWMGQPGFPGRVAEELSRTPWWTTWWK